MACKENLVVSAQLRGLIEEVAGKMLREVYGGGGIPELGTLFSEIEEVGVRFGDALTREIIQQAVAMQASELSEELPSCGVCGKPLEMPDSDPHVVRTRRGDVGWSEPTGYCRRCRKSFFPSVERLGD